MFPWAFLTALLLAKGLWCSLVQPLCSSCAAGQGRDSGHGDTRGWCQHWRSFSTESQAVGWNWEVYQAFPHALSPAEGFTSSSARWGIFSAGEYPAVCLRIGFLLWLGISPENQRDCCCPQESCSPSGHVVWMCVLGYLDTNCELESN